MIIRKDEILVPQKKLSMGLFVTVLVFMMAIQWMTLDMYLPALPVLKKEFASSEAILNFSLNSDLILCAIGMLVGGTISDKYGRKPVMIWGLLLATVPSFLAALSHSVVFLAIMRGITGAGGGVALTVATAVTRDSFEGKTFQLITTITQAAAIIGPVLAPALGAFFIEYMSWRWIFIFLGVAMIISLVPFLLMEETWPEESRQVDSVWQATMQSFNIARDKEYVIFMIFYALLIFPLWAYIGSCSYIYYNEFGVSNLEYSILYATGTLTAFLAPFLYVKAAGKSGNKRAAELILLLMLISCVMLITIGKMTPVIFLVAVVPIIMAEAMIRPLSMVVVLEEYKDEAGSASAVTGFFPMVAGVIATTVSTLNWSSFYFGLTVITTVCMILGVVFWIIMLRKKVYWRQFENKKV